MPGRRGKLLLDEHPLIVLPELACAVGLNEAIVLQQIHYWLASNAERNSHRHFHDGRWWTWGTIEELQRQFPFWSESTVKRAVTKLRENGLLLAGNYNRVAFDRTLWYTIDYDALASIGSKWPNGTGQSDPTYTRDYSETKTLAPPAPAPEVSEKEPIVFDLEEMSFYLEDLRPEQVTAQCPDCGATICQHYNQCPECARPVVWVGSKTWKQYYGKPQEALKKLDLNPKTEFEAAVVHVFGQGGMFQNHQQMLDTRKLARKFPLEYLEGLLGWAKGKSFVAFRNGAMNTANLRTWKEKTGTPDDLWWRNIGGTNDD